MGQFYLIILTLICSKLLSIDAAAQTPYQLRLNLAIVMPSNFRTNFAEDMPVLSDFVKLFKIHNDYARISLIRVGGKVEKDLEMNGDEKAVAEKLKEMASHKVNILEKLNFELEQGLQTVLLFLERSNRTSSALNATLVLTNFPPTDDIGLTVFQKKLEKAIDDVRQLSLLYVIVINDVNRTMSQTTNDQWKTLLADNSLFTPVRPDVGASLKVVADSIAVKACDYAKKVCYFESQQRDVCKADSAGGTPSPYADQCDIKCSVDDCHKTCDSQWPWADSSKCDCEKGLFRQSPDPPNPKLGHCPSTIKCPTGCGSPTNGTDTSAEESSTAVVVGVGIGVVLIIVLAVAVVCYMRKSQSLPDGGGREPVIGKSRKSHRPSPNSAVDGSKKVKATSDTGGYIDMTSSAVSNKGSPQGGYIDMTSSAVSGKGSPDGANSQRSQANSARRR